MPTPATHPSSYEAVSGLTPLTNLLQTPPLLTLSFYSFGVLLRQTTPEGEVEYPVDPAYIAKALAAEITVETGILTGNTVFISTSGTRQIIIEYRPPQKTKLLLEGIDTPIITPLPPLLLTRTTTNHDNPQYSICAVKERPIPSNFNQLWLHQAPLPNTSNGSICWGSVKKVSKEALASYDLGEDWAMLLNTVFTNHSVRGKSKKFSEDIRSHFLHLQEHKAKTYPKRDLVKTNHRLSDFIERLKS